MADKMGNSTEALNALQSMCLDYLLYHRMTKAAYSAREVSVGKAEVAVSDGDRIRGLFDGLREAFEKTTPESQASARILLKALANVVIEATR